MTPHPSDERLGALRDGALSAADAAAAERHLAECEACRARLADLAELDASLAGALEHDPGEAYFASFADRVSARIAQAPAPQPAPRRGLAAWWGSPRRLAWAGSALGVIVMAALVLTLARRNGPQELATQVAPPREVGSEVRAPEASREAESPSARPQDGASGAAPGAANELSSPKLLARENKQVPERGRQGADASRLRGGRADGGATGSLDMRARKAVEPAPVAQAPAAQSLGEQAMARDELKPVPGAPQAPQVMAKRLQEERRSPTGEQLPSQPPRDAQLLKDRADKARGLFARPPAAPATTRSLAGNAARADAPESGASALAPGAAFEKREAAEAAEPFRACGTVTDAQGRAVAGATVSIAESGASTRSGADGAFCLDGVHAGETLSVFAIGHRAYRAGLAAEDAGRPVVVRLTGVDALAPGMRSASGAGAASARLLAQAASSAAARTKTAGAWDLAAQRWSAVLTASATDAARDEARFKVAESRVQAWRAGRDAGRRAAARVATAEYLGAAPAGALRDLAEGWRRELQP